YLKNPEQAFLAGLNLGKKYDLGHLSSLTNKAGSLYNSLIENKYYKFGTALAGKDVWGNKLSWEERLAGLKSYQRNSDWNNKFGDVVEGIIWKKNINLPKIDLPKIGLPNIDLGDIDFKTMGLDGIANYAINLGAKTEGGIGGVLDKLWDSFKELFQSKGVTKDDVENNIRDKLKKEELRAKFDKAFDPNKDARLNNHSADAISMKEFIEYTKGKTFSELQHEVDQGTAGDSSAGGPNYKYRYVIDPANPKRVIDMRHFLVVGPKGEGFGWAIELLQSLPIIGDPNSAWDPQDLFSNALGAEFFKKHYNSNSGISFSKQLKEFFDWWGRK
ncbi:MAG: hypothetical protein AB1630_12890, partial [bacterium]